MNGLPETTIEAFQTLNETKSSKDRLILNKISSMDDDLSREIVHAKSYKKRGNTSHATRTDIGVKINIKRQLI